MSGSNNHLTKFFLIISGFLIAVSILAVYSTTVATEYGAKKDDMQIMSMTHLLKSVDWLNDYEQQKLGEKVLQAQIDTLNITLQNSSNNNISTTIALINNLSIIPLQNTNHILISCMQTDQLTAH